MISGIALNNPTAPCGDRGDPTQGTYESDDWKLLMPEDISYLNALGAKSPTTLYDGDRAMCVLKRIYADPANPDKKVQVSDVAYYDADVVRHKESAIESLAVILKQPSVSGTVRAYMQQTLDALVSTGETLVPTWETARSQMASLLAEAKLILMQRGVDGEAQVIEAMQVIDAVLNNMKNVEGPRTTKDGVDFLQLYSKKVKKECELAVGRGRDSVALDIHLAESRGTAPDKERLQKAVESVRPQARAMADALKRLLAPYAKPVPQADVHKTQQDNNQGRLVGTWQMA